MTAEQNYQKLNISELECTLSFERLSLKNLQCSSKEVEVETSSAKNNFIATSFRFFYINNL